MILEESFVSKQHVTTFCKDFGFGLIDQKVDSPRIHFTGNQGNITREEVSCDVISSWPPGEARFFNEATKESGG